jgi:serine/threonine protein phosphatase 1
METVLAGGKNRAMAPSGTRIYAVGDIHGRADLLDRLLDRIVTNANEAAATAARRRVLVFLGDYVDRGPDARTVIERLTEPPPDGFELVCLRGNHEQMMLDCLADPDAVDLWLFNGGSTTLESYGLPPADPWQFPPDGELVRRWLRSGLPPHHLAFLKNLADWHREGDYLFVHAGIRPGVPMERQSAWDLAWIRDDFLLSDADFGAVVVHGHTITGRPEVRCNRIGIDTGAYRSGRLTCLVLEAEKRHFLHT